MIQNVKSYYASSPSVPDSLVQKRSAKMRVLFRIALRSGAVKSFSVCKILRLPKLLGLFFKKSPICVGPCANELWYFREPTNRCQRIRAGFDSLLHIMGWLRLVSSLKLQVYLAKGPYKRDCILQKRPIILRSLLIVATHYQAVSMKHHVTARRTDYSCKTLPILSMEYATHCQSNLWCTCMQVINTYTNIGVYQSDTPPCKYMHTRTYKYVRTNTHVQAYIHINTYAHIRAQFKSITLHHTRVPT